MIVSLVFHIVSLNNCFGFEHGSLNSLFAFLFHFFNFFLALLSFGLVSSLRNLQLIVEELDLRLILLFLLLLCLLRSSELVDQETHLVIDFVLSGSLLRKLILKIFDHFDEGLVLHRKIFFLVIWHTHVTIVCNLFNYSWNVVFRALQILLLHEGNRCPKHGRITKTSHGSICHRQFVYNNIIVR